jgi:hypothetical protein
MWSKAEENKKEIEASPNFKKVLSLADLRAHLEKEPYVITLVKGNTYCINWLEEGKMMRRFIEPSAEGFKIIESISTNKIIETRSTLADTIKFIIGAERLTAEMKKEIESKEKERQAKFNNIIKTIRQHELFADVSEEKAHELMAGKGKFAEENYAILGSSDIYQVIPAPEGFILLGQIPPFPIKRKKIDIAKELADNPKFCI